MENTDLSKIIVFELTIINLDSKLLNSFRNCHRVERDLINL